MSSRQRKILLYVSLGVNILLVIGLAVLLLHARKKNNEPSKSDFPFLSSRIFTENQNDLLLNFVPLRTALQDYVAKQNNNVGVYFEYLPTGSSISVNSDMEVKIASLIKIPTVMAIYRQIEKGKLSPDQKLTVQAKDIDTGFGDLWKSGVGKQLTVQQAIDLTLKQSDNTADNILHDQLKNEDILDVLDTLDIPLEKDGVNFIISPKNYTSILRSLYLSSYLTKANSNTLLNTLTKTAFLDKLPAGVSGNVPVAHKIGVFDLNNADYMGQVYSDCGIIYVPNRPYALCVMVENNDNAQATQIIKHISEMTYKYMQAVR